MADNASDTQFLATLSSDCVVAKGLGKFALEFQYPNGIITLIISAFGVVFNLLNIAVLTSPKMRTPVNLLLTFLSLTELCLFTIYIPYIILFNLASPADSPRYATDNKTLAYYLLFYADASVFLHLSSIWLIITTSFFRFLLVQIPLAAVKWCTYKRAIVAGTLTVCASLLLTLPNILRNAVGPFNYTIPAAHNLNTTVPTIPINCYRVNATPDEQKEFYKILPSQHFLQSAWATTLNYWLYAALGKFLPCILLIVFTGFLIRVLQEAEIRQQRLHSDGHNPLQSQSQHGILRRKSRATNSSVKSSSSTDRSSDYHQTTRMLLAVVISFIVVELPHGILLLWAELSDRMIVYDLLGDVIDLATLAAFSINFVLYSIMSRQYRMLFIALITKPFKHTSLHHIGSRRKFTRRRNSFRTMHTEHSELHPLNHRRASMGKKPKFDKPKDKKTDNHDVVDV